MSEGQRVPSTLISSVAALSIPAVPEAHGPLKSPLLRKFQVDMGVRFGLAGPRAVECLKDLLRLLQRLTSFPLLPEKAEGVWCSAGITCLPE